MRVHSEPLKSQLRTSICVIKMKVTPDFKSLQIQMKDNRTSDTYRKVFENGQQKLNKFEMMSHFKAFQAICQGVKTNFGEEIVPVSFGEPIVVGYNSLFIIRKDTLQIKDRNNNRIFELQPSWIDIQNQFTDHLRNSSRAKENNGKQLYQFGSGEPSYIQISDDSVEIEPYRNSLCIRTSCKGIQNFLIKRREITKIGEECSQLFGNIPISVKNSFTIKIEKSQKMIIGLGVIDSRLFRSIDIYLFNEGIICYFGRNGWMSEENKKSDRDNRVISKVGDIITVGVCQEKGLIQWKINGKNFKRFSMKMLKDNKIEWMPYLRMQSHGDKVIWLE